MVRNGSTNVGAPLSGNGFDLDFGIQSITGTYTVVATNTVAGCTGTMTGNATITAGVVPTAYTVTGGGSFCSGPGVQVGLTSSQSGVNYQLVRDGNTNVGSAITGNGLAIDFGSQNITGTYTVLAVNNTTGCTSTMTGSASVLAGSLPQTFNVTGGGIFCNGTGSVIGLSGSESGVTYQLVRNGNTNVGASVSGNGLAIDFGLQTVSGTYTVIGTRTNGGCTNSMTGSASIQSGTAPTTFNVTGGGSFCSGPGVAVGLTGSQPGVNYQLVLNGNNAGVPIAGTGSPINFGIQSADGLYTVVATSATSGCTINMIGSASIISGVAPIAYTVTGGGTVCGANGAPIGLSGSETGVNYQLVRDGSTNVGSAIPGSGAALNFGNLTIAGTYTVVATSSSAAACTSSMTGSAQVTVSTVTNAGSISGAITVCAGNNTGTLNLAGFSGSILRWESSIDGGQGWTNIANTTASLTFNNLMQATMYRALVSGCTDVYTSPVTVNVTLSSVGGTLTSNRTTGCFGYNSGIITLSGNTGNVIRWESTTNNGATWTQIANTTNTLNYLNLNLTTTYRAVVGGCSTTYSSLATITIVRTAVGGTLSGSATVCPGNNSGTLSISGQAGNIVRWERSINNGSSWTNINSFATTLDYLNITQTTQYRVLVGGCGTVYSTVATLTPGAGTNGGAVSGAATVCSGANSGTLNLAGNSGTVVRWESSINGGSSWTSISNTSTTQNYSNLTQTTQFRAIVLGCNEVASTPATVTVSTVSVGGSLTGDAVVCAGTNSGTISLSGYSGTILRWESTVNDGATWTTINNVTTNLNYLNLGQTTKYRAVIGGCSTVFSTLATISVTNAAVGGSISGSTTVCSGTNSGTLNLFGYAGTITKWQRSVNTGGTWTDIANTTASLTFSNLTTTTQYRAVIGGCSIVNSSIATVTVSPVSVGGTVNTSATVCSGSNSGTLTLSGHTGSVVRWESSTNGGSSWITIPNATTSLFYSGLTQSTRYRAYVSSGVCSAVYSTPAVITVTTATVAGTLSGSTTHCTSTNTGTVTLNGSVGTIMRWEYSFNGTNWNTLKRNNVTVTDLSYTYTNLNRTTWYRVRVKGCTEVYSTFAKITIGGCTVAIIAPTITPKPAAVDPQSVTSGLDATLSLQVYPNPSSNLFTLVIKGNSREIANVRVYDGTGRVVETMKAASGQSLQFGGGYVQGMYLVEVNQGTERKVIKAIKQ